MPIFPVRRLGSAGIVPDVAPADLENISAFTGGVNVRFKNGRASRAPIFRSVAALDHDPGHLLSIPPVASSFEEVVSVAADYSTITRLNGTLLEDLTPPDHDGEAGTQAITSGFVGGVTYLNRETHAPLIKRVTDDTFVSMPDWPVNDRCKVLRHYKDQMIALGVTKAGAFYPTMVRWSDFVTFGSAPSSWDPSDPTKSAGENIINGMNHAIVDGAPLRDSFVIYGVSSVWLMDFVGGNDIYQFRKLFDDVGAINANCVSAVGGLHYVFDRNDIYVHDGVTPRSICDERAKRFIFDALDFSRAHLCFVQHDAKLTEVRFSYPGDDTFTGFRSPTTGCNRQAVFNYSNDTWTFYDVPNIVGYTKAALVYGENWDLTEPTWKDAPAIWTSSENDQDRHMLVASRQDVGMGLTSSCIYGQDLINGGRLGLPLAPETLKPALLERTGLDLDAYGKHLTQHVNIQAIWPQLGMDSWEDCSWQFGGTNFLATAPTWSQPQTFNPTTETKVDTSESGKYLAYRFRCGGSGDFELSSFDVELLVRGRR